VCAQSHAVCLIAALRALDRGQCARAHVTDENSHEAGREGNGG
jgi:hypothetical protein